MKEKRARGRRQEEQEAPPTEIVGQIPPNDLDLEKDLLGACLRDRTAVLQARAVVQPDRLFGTDHQIIFEAMLAVVADGHPASVSFVRSKLKNMGMLDRVGGARYLSELATTRPEVKSVVGAAERLSELYRLRGIIETGRRIAALGQEAANDIQGYAEMAVREVNKVAYSGRQDAEQLSHIAPTVDASMAGVRQRSENGSAVSGIATGYREVDEMTCGLMEGDVWYIAGRPGHGKAQPVDCKVLAPDGTWRRMGDLAVGDAIAGPWNLPQVVEGVFPQGTRDVWEVELEGGKKTRCCDEHLWWCAVFREGVRARPVPTVLATAEIRALVAEPGTRVALPHAETGWPEWSWVASITAAGATECRCIAVSSPRRLYITDDYIVTHNTSALLGILANITAPLPEGEPVETPEIGAAFFSLEMPRLQIANRLLCMTGDDAVRARISIERWRSGRLRPQDWGPAYAAADKLRKSRLWIDDTPAISLEESEAKLMALKAEWEREPTYAGCHTCQRQFVQWVDRGVWYCPACTPDPSAAGAFVVEKRVQLTRARIIGVAAYDYFGLMAGDPNARSREEAMSNVSKGFKTLSKRRKVASLVAAQLNREVEKRNAKERRPQLSDLRETGSLEQDGDTIILLYQAAKYRPNDEKVRGKAEWDIAKQRNGKTGRVTMRYSDWCSRFDDEFDGPPPPKVLPPAPPVEQDEDLPPGL